ncbi:GNAT family N-acetyltransferase [Marisediminicola senii]|uniref:GNAT family N-acetyltransferase n=1 Tax=Marisediminicola senii TaxID=2711233 RepID=UPI0013ED3F02|nr:GNAT family N-acetyltransferase [Marisediminicola senii]
MTARIRLVHLDDDEALAELLDHNRGYLAPWEPVRDSDYFSVAGQHADIEMALVRHARGEVMPFVVLNDHGEVAGRITLSNIARGPLQSCTMGYWVAEDQTGKGLATEAVRAATACAFTEVGLHRVQAETLLANVASQKVLAKNGFKQYGLAPEYLKIAGVWQDHLMFQRLNGTG